MKYYLIDPCYVEKNTSDCRNFQTDGDGLKVIKVNGAVKGTACVDSGMLALVPINRVKNSENPNKLGVLLELDNTEKLEIGPIFDWSIEDINIPAEGQVAINIYELPNEISESLELLDESTTLKCSFMGVEYPSYYAIEEATIVAPLAIVEAINNYYEISVLHCPASISPDLN